MFKSLDTNYKYYISHTVKTLPQYTALAAGNGRIHLGGCVTTKYQTDRQTDRQCLLRVDSQETRLVCLWRERLEATAYWRPSCTATSLIGGEYGSATCVWRGKTSSFWTFWTSPTPTDQSRCSFFSQTFKENALCRLYTLGWWILKLYARKIRWEIVFAVGS